MKRILRYLYYLKSYLKFKARGRNLILSKGGTFVRPEEVSFGNNVFISSNFYISARNLVFKNNIMIGPNLVIECDNHIYNEVGKVMFDIREKRNISSVLIENDVWIGANVTILSGVTIGEGTIIGAGSVVTKSQPKYSICVGNPCKPIKKRFTEEELKIHLEKIKFK
jgi:acetyltransferase-like isoleucine patch superfamily enzyme